MEVKEEWKDTGKDLGRALMGLGRTIVHTAKVGIDKLDSYESPSAPADKDAATDDKKEG